MSDPEPEKQAEAGPAGEPPEPSRPAVSPALLAVLAVVLLWAFFFATGLGGLEFGEHWDEERLLRSTWRAVGTGSFRPSYYVYPAVTHWLAWLPALPTFLGGFPDAKRCLAAIEPDPRLSDAWMACFAQWTKHAAGALAPKVILLRARFLFLFVSSATVVLTGLAAWRWRRRAGEVALAAGVVALSWEVQYHARWTAPDAVLMTAAALTLLVLHEAEQRNSDRWMSAAAASAAVGAATKLTGGLLLLPVLLAGATTPRAGHVIPRLDARRAARLVATFAVAFCLLTPGVLVDLPQVVMEVLYESRHYATGHGPYSVSPGPVHLAKMLVYVLGPLLSARWPLGFVLGALALAGAWASWQDGSRTMRAFTITAGVSLLYLCSQRVMIVRNLIWLAPLLAVWIARGASFAAERVPARLPRSLGLVPAVIAASILALDAAFIAEASARVPERQLDGHPARAIAAALQNPSARIHLTDAARARFADTGTPIPPNVVARAEADYVIGLFSELAADAVPANTPGTFALGLTAPEVNLDYYPTNLDRERFVALRASAWPAR